jgi:hypothetical protein
LTEEITVSTPDLTHAQWRKSSHSNGDGNECVEVAVVSGAIAVRDSKNPGGGLLVLSSCSWRAFQSTVNGS